MILKKAGKVFFNSLLMAMLLGILIMPISSMGLMNLVKQSYTEPNANLPSLNSEVLSAQDEKKKVQRVSESTQTKETTQTTKSTDSRN